MTAPRVRVVMMCHNEGQTLDVWLAHYSHLFGWRSLTIFDNGSTDHRTLASLGHAERMGALVHFDCNTPSHFDRKGDLFADVIRQWDRRGGYDFALPVDCDELLAVFTKYGLTTDRGMVWSELDRLRGEQRALRIDMSLFNVPGAMSWYCPDRHFVKSLLAAGTILHLDHGFHAARSRLDDSYVSTRLTYLHHHNQPLAVAQAAARRKLAGRVDLDDPEAVAAHFQPGKPGAHLVPMLTMTDGEYRARYDDQVRVYVPPAGWGWMPNQIATPDQVLIWDGLDYLRANQDVAERYELGALHHYLRHGYAEGRPLVAGREMAK